jgi:hypothetical protein
VCLFLLTRLSCKEQCDDTAVCLCRGVITLEALHGRLQNAFGSGIRRNVKYPQSSYISSFPLSCFFFFVSSPHPSSYISSLSIMRLLSLCSAVLAASTVCALPTQSGTTQDIAVRADPSLVGYLGVFFLGSEPNVYFYLSNGNNAISFKALNAGKKILDPTLGTGGVRDPSIISGAGAEAGKKWYIIGTDLDIAKVCQSWDLYC